MSEKEHLQNLLEIKEMMSKSTRFISLSGISGILAGVYALVGAYFAYDILQVGAYEDYRHQVKYITANEIFALLLMVSLVALISIATAIFLSYKKAKKNKEKLWNSTSKRLVINLIIPLLAGGLFLIISLLKNDLTEVSSLMLLFYGLSLVNASKYTIGHIKVLGYINIFLGLLCHYYTQHSFWFWVFGFGIMHIIYGSIMHFILDRKNGANK